MLNWLSSTMRTGQHRFSHRGASRCACRDVNSFAVRSSLEGIFEWYPLNPYAEFILDSDIFVKERERFDVIFDELGISRD